MFLHLLLFHNKFQSTRPMRDATAREEKIKTDTGISIHASHAGRDDKIVSISGVVQYAFQSTRPMRDATYDYLKDHLHIEFQSTRPMRDATDIPSMLLYHLANFNPRVPCGTRPFQLVLHIRR